MRQVRIVQLLVAMALLGAIVTPIALAGAHGSRAGRPSAQARALKLLKGVKAETATIAAEIASLRERTAVLAAPKQAPPTAPNGPAGGGLSGSYPSPRIGADAISSATVVDGAVTGADIGPATIQSLNIADGSIGSADIADGSVGQADLGAGSVGAAQLVGAHVVTGGPSNVSNGGTGEVSAACPAGERLLSGGGGWGVVEPNLFLVFSRPDEHNASAWNVLGRNDSGRPAALFAFALCLKAG